MKHYLAPRIAIVGMACCYPDAQSPMTLWENVLAGRQSFRRIPPERLCLEDYNPDRQHVSDSTYCSQAAVTNSIGPSSGYQVERFMLQM
jgi:acyl transferase domain-containing protein